MKLLLAVLMVGVLGVGALCFQTDGFTVLTTEAARRADIARHPKALPDAALRMSAGVSAPFLQALREDGRIAIVNFMYTRCFSICLAMGGEFQQLQDAIQQGGLSDRVRIISLSFDPADTSDDLARYAARMRAQPGIWQFAGIADAEERKALLDAFGIVVVPAPLGQYEHNAAYHVVTPEGQLARIVDIGDAAGLLDDVSARIRGVGTVQ
ncbi:SCO family protein [Pollutimonas sp. H1-120]|uniref:SCO family protein n=1 Tax=Pollutimonas sp. H1-120 TaxID=3148824 RepID=UPI003B52943F